MNGICVRSNVGILVQQYAERYVGNPNRGNDIYFYNCIKKCYVLFIAQLFFLNY